MMSSIRAICVNTDERGAVKGFFFFSDYLTNSMHEFFCGGKLRRSLSVSM